MGRFAKKSEPERTYDIVHSFEIKNVRETKYGVRFTLILNGVSINGVTVREAKDGTAFISLPNYKGKDGKYYNHVFFRFSPDDTNSILSILEGCLNDE